MMAYPLQKEPTAEDIGAIRQGAELNAVKPYLDNEIAGMQRAVVSSVLNAVNKGELTPEMAMSKWMEYIAYYKMSQKVEQRIAVGASVGSSRNLDFK